MTIATELCPCGMQHPPGYHCPQALQAQENQVHEQGCGCGHDHLPLMPVQLHSLGTASKTRAIYRIMNMDCPIEEGLIRKKLDKMPGITHLEFNLLQRVLVVEHNLPSTAGIEAALQEIAMHPEPIEVQNVLSTEFSIPGMDCPVEENLIKSKLENMDGVLGLDFNLIHRSLKIRHDPQALPAISQALLALDLGAVMVDSHGQAKVSIAPTKIPWLKLGTATVLALVAEILMLMHEWQVQPWGINIQNWQILGFSTWQWLPMFLAIIAVVLAGLGTYKKGWVAISNANLNINALMSVAVTGAIIIGQYPEAAMVMVLFTLSEAIESKALDRARNAIQGLLALAPDKALVLQNNDQWQEMDIRQVALGSRVRVGPGEKVGLDGIIVHGQSTINQAPITGESLPVEKNIGDTVYAGTINESGSFEFEVTAMATNSTLARIIHAVEEAQGTKAPMQRFVDQFAKYYTPLVFLVAIFAAVLPPLFWGSLWTTSIYTALIILVIGCPCALVISTPVTIVSAMAAATRYGILIKGGTFLEQGRLLQWIALDKTGTITHGQPRQTDFVNLGPLPSAQAQSMAASLAQRSDHPVSQAIAQHAQDQDIAWLPVQDFSALPGQGIQGKIEDQLWYLGNERLVAQLGHSTPQIQKQMTDLEKMGKTVIALISDAGVQGLWAVADTIKESSIQAINELKKMGVQTIMLTGDNEHTAQVIADQAQVDQFKAQLLPEDKLEIIKDLEAQGAQVGMVGDGINDAPALAQAHVGFAMAGGGTDTAIESADVALMDDDLRKIPRFIALSQATYKILVQNISFALGVKALFFALAVTGLATMWMAVFADVGAALIVVANGLRAMRF